MRHGRLFRILYLLMERGEMTAGELAERLEVSKRTVYRDLDALSAAGIPVYARQGKNGGICLMEQFKLDRSLFDEREQDEILTALSGLKALGLLEEKEILTRLSGLFRRRPTEWLEVDFESWGAAGEEKACFELCRRAILERHPVTFRYYNSSGEGSLRTVEPVRLRFKGGNWYLAGYCRAREDFRLFRLNRMEGLWMEPETAEPREWPKEETESGWEMMPLSLWFSPEAAYRVLDTFPAKEIARQADGSFLVQTAFPPGRWVLGFLLSFGAQVRVLEPEWMRREVLREAERILEEEKLDQD